VKVNVQVQRAAEALDQRHRTGLARGLSESCVLHQMRGARPVHDTEHRAHGRWVRGEEVAQRKRHREHPLAQRLARQHLIHQQRGSLHHAPGGATRAEAAALAAIGDQPLGVALGAADPGKALVEAPRLQIGRELLLHVAGQRPAACRERGKKPRVVLFNQLIEKRRFRAVALVAPCSACGLSQWLHARSLYSNLAAMPAAFLWQSAQSCTQA